MHVYFLHSASKQRVKIGVARNLARRFDELEREHGPLRLVHSIRCDSSPASFKLEKALHHWFARQHLQLEWFEEAVLDSIEGLDPRAVLRLYAQTRVYEVRLARADVEALAERGLSISDAVLLALGAVRPS